jgi:hypothetical protein
VEPTSWPPDDDDGAAASAVVAEAFARFDLPAKPPASSVPAEETLAVAENLRGALATTGFTDIDLHERTYRQLTSVDDYVRELAWFGRGRYHQSIAAETTLVRFRRELTSELAHQFPKGIRRTHPFRIVVGTRRRHMP